MSCGPSWRERCGGPLVFCAHRVGCAREAVNASERSVSTEYLISAVLIVKNEQEHLPACLAALDGVVDEIVVADTGSTDRTREVAEGFTERVFLVPWTQDFAAARNAAIAHARGAWILSIDADECIEGGEHAGATLREFVARHGAGVVGRMAIHNVDDGSGVIEETIDHTERFFYRAGYQYAGAIHEQLESLGPQKLAADTGVQLIHTGYAQDPAASDHKARRNIPLLIEAIATHPDDEYAYFQLGKAHYALKEYALAAEAFDAALARMQFDGAQLPQGRLGLVARPVLTACLVNRAYALVNLGRAQEARSLLDTHRARAHPGVQWADFAHVYGYVGLMLGDLVAARAGYGSALQLGPTREDVVGTGSFASHYHLGLIDEALGNSASAQTRYAAALAQRPGYRPAVSRAIDWLLEGHAPAGTALLRDAQAETVSACYLDRLERSLHNGAEGDTRQLVAVAEAISPELQTTVNTWMAARGA